jgi:glutathione S-transferase
VTSLTLFHFPGACSQVTLCALEASGLDYDLELVNLAKNEQSDPAYLAKSPLGKVPALRAEGEVLTENAALLIYIDAIAPDAGLFPKDRDARLAAHVQAGLSFCGGTLHPIVRGLANPSRLTAGDEDGVRTRSAELAKKSFGYADKRLAANGWWLGERSIIDVYLSWAASIARRGGFDIDAFPAIAALPRQLEAWPAYVRMLEIEARSLEQIGA